MTGTATDPRALEDAFVLPSYSKFPFVLDRAADCRVFDGEGREYLDFYAGHAVAWLGHDPKPVLDAIRAQSERFFFYSNLAYTPVRGEAARALALLNGRPDGKVFFCNSGAEANENAMALARLTTGRDTILSTSGSFHGRTAGALGATGLSKYTAGKPGLAANRGLIPFGDLEAAKAAIGPDTAGVIVEPIQSMAGIVEPPEGYLAGLAAAAAERGALLIFDEVQTGMGRVGARSAASLYGVEPDLQTFAKALGSGFPCGAVLAGPKASAAVGPGSLGSTFGGGPLACAAIRATAETIEAGRLWERAAELETELRTALALPGIRRIRGRGLLLGLELDSPAKAAHAALLRRGILTGTSEDPAVLRLLPPVVIGSKEISALRDALKEAL